MRRFIIPVVTLVAVWTPPLGGQSAFSVGYAGTIGSEWQVEAFEVGLAHRVGLGPARYGAVLLRLGWFGDQGALIGGTRGFLSALALAIRSDRLGIAEVGQEADPIVIGVDVTVEAAGYLASRSPIPEGSRWSSVALLPAVRVGQAEQTQFALLVGPAWFAGDVTRTHVFLGVRVEVPLARRGGAP